MAALHWHCWRLYYMCEVLSSGSQNNTQSAKNLSRYCWFGHDCSCGHVGHCTDPNGGGWGRVRPNGNIFVETLICTNYFVVNRQHIDMIWPEPPLSSLTMLTFHWGLAGLFNCPQSEKKEVQKYHYQIFYLKNNANMLPRILKDTSPFFNYCTAMFAMPCSLES